MTESFAIFLSGLAGVFGGMALLYVSIRITTLITGRLTTEDKKDG